MAIENGGRYTCRAIGPVVVGESSNKKTPYIELNFKIEEGPNAGGVLKWQGYFSEKTQDRTFEALRTMGWEGDDLSEFADNMLHGLEKNLVSVQAELEEYVNKEGRKAITAKAAWINPLGYVDTRKSLSGSSLADLSARMRAAAIKSKSQDGGGGDNKDPWDEVPATGKDGKGKEKKKTEATK